MVQLVQGKQPSRICVCHIASWVFVHNRTKPVATWVRSVGVYVFTKHRGVKMYRINFLWTEDKVKKLLELREQGLSARLIANEMGVTRNSVIGKVHRLGLKFRSTKWSFSQSVREGLRHRQRSINGRGLKGNRQKFPSYPLPIETDVPPSTAVQLLDLEEHHCRYVFNSGRNALFCGADKTHGSYCEKHHHKCHTRAP